MSFSTAICILTFYNCSKVLFWNFLSKVFPSTRNNFVFWFCVPRTDIIHSWLLLCHSFFAWFKVYFSQYLSNLENLSCLKFLLLAEANPLRTTPTSIMSKFLIKIEVSRDKSCHLKKWFFVYCTKEVYESNKSLFCLTFQ
jgi:hypothetical protein